MTLSDDVASLKGVGPEVASKLARLGVATTADLINHWPRQYEDYSSLQTIASIQPGPVSLRVTFSQVKGRYVRRGMHITEAAASDETGAVKVVWFNQPYRADGLQAGREYFLVGELAFNRRQFSITNPSIEQVSDLPTNAARILPKYRETRGLNSSTLRKLLILLKPLIAHLPENLPTWIVQDYHLISHAQAIEQLHFPTSMEELAPAKHRLAFEEAFGLTLASRYAKADIEQEHALAIPFDQAGVKDFVDGLPFALTDGQRLISWQILQDMTKPHPMNRLIEGDVGSGKTVVATIAALNTVRAGHQVLLLAPTDLLARQHYRTLRNLLTRHIPDERIQLLVGALTAKQKSQIKQLASDHVVDILIGTHALIEQSVDVSSLGLVIIDEQHRFGVRQRQKLISKAKLSPHVLSLTATPIPRSLALTLYGELDVSILKDKPANRQPITTDLHSVNSRPQLYELVAAELQKGRQAYIVCPLISKSDTVKHISVNELHQLVSKTLLPTWRVGLLHGKLAAKDKEQVMSDFVNHKLDVLVSTTVIEVGVDVPNATVMVIEGADAFGLAQLHQLRGRVGRGAEASFCYLVPSTSEAPSQRLKAIASSQDGFKLAELDLELRGPGQIYGTLQHGALDLRLIRLSDTELIEAARSAAEEFIQKGENLLDYPQFAQQVEAFRAITHLN